MSAEIQTTTPATAEPIPPWASVREAGGIREWVEAELARRGLIESVDTSALSAEQKKQFKARRDEERRVRRLLRKAAWASYKRAHLVHLGAGIFHHDTADLDRFDADDPEARRKDNDLPELADAQALAAALGLPIPTLRWLAFHREVDTGTHYHRWTVPKRSGGARLISAPKKTLKTAQKWIATNIVEHLPVHGAAHGFLPGRSTKTNAEVHVGARLVVKLDLSDFYPTITLERVKGLFRKAGYGEQVATVLALLCTESPREAISLRGRTCYVALGPRSLPQGAPTSPSITNALCLRMDSRLSGLARKFGFRYSRYADDLAFSWHGEGEGPVGELLGAVHRIVRGEGFVVHPKKTRILRCGRRQKVTGLVVNGQGPPRVPRALVRKLRAAIHHREHGKQGKGETLAQLRGWAAYVHMCDPQKGRAFLERLAKLGEA
ncbi:MAG: reverse transcriptase family protein [Sandaracinaceae bacterium]|nr:reverse transcriptase family protein [Sandaracinaceae bacterium]